MNANIPDKTSSKNCIISSNKEILYRKAPSESFPFGKKNPRDNTQI